MGTSHTHVQFNPPTHTMHYYDRDAGQFWLVLLPKPSLVNQRALLVFTKTHWLPAKTISYAVHCVVHGTQHMVHGTIWHVVDGTWCAVCGV